MSKKFSLGVEEEGSYKNFNQNYPRKPKRNNKYTNGTHMKQKISTTHIVNSYKEFTQSSLKEFPTLKEYCEFVCVGDYTVFDDYNSLAQAMLQDELDKGIPHG